MPAFICDHIQELSLAVAAISAFIAAISAIAAFVANHQNKKQYKESVQPQLSMSLVEFNSFLYLRVKNTGKSAARNIEIRVNGVRNNGSSDKLFLDDLFNGEFELYPEETAQGKVAICHSQPPHRHIPLAMLPQKERGHNHRIDPAAHSKQNRFAILMRVNPHCYFFLDSMEYENPKVRDSINCTPRLTEVVFPRASLGPSFITRLSYRRLVFKQRAKYLRSFHSILLSQVTRWFQLRR